MQTSNLPLLQRIDEENVPVTLIISNGGLKGPQELAIYIVNEAEGKFMLKWLYFSIKGMQFDHFEIFRDGQLYGTTIQSYF